MGDSPGAVADLLGTPSERISVEVRELVARAQIEVRRTRESLLNYLSAHKPTAPTDPTAGLAREEDEEAEKQEEMARWRRLEEGEEGETPSPDSPAGVRARLRENAGRILRRLQGYDRRDHGVLPMEGILSVIYRILHPREAVPGRALSPGGVCACGHRAGLPETPLPPSRFRHREPWRETQRKRPRGEAAAGCSATRPSPTRTLERVMARCADPVEGAMLDFYTVFLRVFQEVFGERYAWRHLGVTNASRHDARALPGQKGKAMGRGAGTNEREEIVDLNDIEGPLEEVFPRLRQHYAFEKDSAGRAVDSRRPPPLDALVYYKRLVASLEEL
ncbi:unnamed protein product [Phytomonas sp. EM1]|nr:unnamed protein product [Phytomonas sp. EM1]|eukprot:CCW63957.1 unnamed protein product [Phytomonas sp. isolate EM1]